MNEWINEGDLFGKEKKAYDRLRKLENLYGQVKSNKIWVREMKECLVKGSRELILELSVGADICHGLKVTQINNSAIICYMFDDSN